MTQHVHINIKSYGTIAVLLAVCSFSFFQFLLPYHLFFKEQIQLFLLTGEHFLSYTERPAWAACYAGDFFTQFFYLRGGGAVALTLTLLAEYALTVAILRRMGWGRHAPGIAWLPAAADGFLHSGLYYGLPASMSLLIAGFAFWAFTWIKKPLPAFVAGLAALPCLYSLAGAAFFLFPVLAAAHTLRRGGRRWLCALAWLSAAGVCPAVVGGRYLLTAEQAYRYPFPSSLSLRGVDSDRETILSLAVEAGRGNWREVSRRAEAAGTDHLITAYYAHIASSKQGRLAESLTDDTRPFAGGLFLPVNPQSGWMSIFFSNEVFYHLGDMQMARHSAMLGMIFSPHRRSVQMLKRLTEIDLAVGDTATAGKYLRILDATLFHRRWAERRRATPTPQIPDAAPDMLRTASDYAASLEWLIENDPRNPYAVDYLLCYHLLRKDIPAFAAAYDRYRKAADGGEYIPPLYGEALLIKLAAGKAPLHELQSYGIPDDAIAGFIDYTRLYAQGGGTPDALRERFGGRYWFYYHFARPGKEDDR
jgi:hypothetical protein